MGVKVIPFGQLTDIIGKSPIDLNAGDTDDLQRLLEEKFPGISSSKFAIAVNRQIISTNTELNDSYEVALLPPSSGG